MNKIKKNKILTKDRSNNFFMVNKYFEKTITHRVLFLEYKLLNTKIKLEVIIRQKVVSDDK